MLPSQRREFPRELGWGLLNMMLGKSLGPCNPSWPSGAVKGLYPAVQPYMSPELGGNPKSVFGSLPASCLQGKGFPPGWPPQCGSSCKNRWNWGP